MKLRLIHLLSMAALIFAVSCSEDDPNQIDPFQNTPPADFTFVRFNPADGDPAAIPLPNDLLRNPATGQVAFPQTGDPAVDGLVAQVNTLFGFSTSSGVRIPFVNKVNADSVNNQTMLVVDLVELAAAGQGAQVNPFKEMTFTVKDDETGANSVILAKPVRPLNPGNTHLVIMTQGLIGAGTGTEIEPNTETIFSRVETPLVDANGNSLRPTLSDAQAQGLEPLRAAYQPIWAAAEAVTGQDRNQIPFAFTFTTQPLFSTLPALRARVQNENPTPNITLAATGQVQVDGFFQQLDTLIPGAAQFPRESIGSIYFGTYDAANYLSAPVNGVFGGEGDAVPQVSRANIQFVASMPPGAGPYPVAIFQHGLGGAKETALFIANSLNAQGVGVIGIDLVAHGSRVGDFFNNETGQPGPDGVPDASGTGFINLLNVLNSRDNVRQSVSDLFTLTRMITSGATDFNGDGAADMLPVGVSYIGQSLGAIVGSPFVATEPNVGNVVLNVGGGRIGELLQNSQALSPSILAGLGAVGITPESNLFDIFWLFAQGIIDDADAFNYAPYFANGGLAGGATNNVLVQEAIGDAVVPNSATRDLVRAARFPQFDALEAVDELEQLTTPGTGSGLYQFDAQHGVLLLPTQGPTVEVQTQALFYLGTGLLGNPTIVNPFQPLPSSKVAPKVQDYYPGPDAPDYKNLVVLPQK